MTLRALFSAAVVVVTVQIGDGKTQPAAGVMTVGQFMQLSESAEREGRNSTAASVYVAFTHGIWEGLMVAELGNSQSRSMPNLCVESVGQDYLVASAFQRFRQLIEQSVEKGTYVKDAPVRPMLLNFLQRRFPCN
jgi:hypothetical protein